MNCQNSKILNADEIQSAGQKMVERSQPTSNGASAEKHDMKEATQYIMVAQRTKQQIINISSSESESQGSNGHMPVPERHQGGDYKAEKTKKIKKVSIKCPLCKSSGKKTEMKGCINCRHSFHISCIEQEHRSIPKRYTCDKCHFQKQQARKQEERKLRYEKQQLGQKQRKKQQINKKQKQTFNTKQAHDKHQKDRWLTEPKKSAAKQNGSAVSMGEKTLVEFMRNSPTVGGQNQKWNWTNSNASNAPKKSEKERKKEDFSRRLGDFSERYPYYVQDEKIKFPINDKLLLIYSELFEVNETQQTFANNSFNNNGKVTGLLPAPKPHPFVPGDKIGDLLQIENFFVSFKQQLGNAYFFDKDCLMKNLYFFLNNEIIDEYFSSMLYCLLKLYLSDIFEKNKTDNVRMLNQNCFFILLGNMNESEDLAEQVLVLAAEDILRNLAQVPSLRRSLQNFIFPPKYNMDSKVYILVSLIKGLSDVDTFHEFVSLKSEKMQSLTKQKGELISLLKVDEAENLSNKEKIKQFNTLDNNLKEQLNKNDENGSIANSRQITREKDKNKKKIIKLSSQKVRSETSIKEIRTKISEISKTLPFVTSMVVFLGKDRNQSEYFFYCNEPSRIYCKYRNFVLDDSEEYWVYDGREGIVELQKALNVKGSQEKQLSDMIASFLKEEIINAQKPCEPKPETVNILNKKEGSDGKEQQSEYEVIHDSECDGEMNSGTFYEEKYAMLSKQSLVKMVLEAEERFTTYLLMKNLQWASESERQSFIGKIESTEELQQIKQMIVMLQDSFLFVEPISEEPRVHRLNLDSDEDMVERKEVKKKSPVRLWGINSERIKKYWVEYLEESIDLKGIWICANILKNYVDRYVKKKMDYLHQQSKKDGKLERQKEKKRLRREKEESRSERYSRERSRDDRYDRNGKGERSHRVHLDESSCSNGNAPSMRPNLRERKKTKRAMEMDSEPDYDEDYKVEREELGDSELSESDDKCEICSEYGEMICCDTCPRVYHLECLKIAELPEGEWSCLKCLEKLANERQTRSKVRKLTKYI